MLILDVSGSMKRENRLEVMKQAAKRVVSTLTLADHVAVVTFHTFAKSIMGETMLQATEENKARILKAIGE